MNLLTEPIFRVATPGGHKRVSLPALLDSLGRDQVESFPGLLRHQEDAFHIFLCYLAGAVLAREATDDPIQDETFWRDGIRRLTGRNDDYAWTLVVDDATAPAFMQPPLESNGAIRAFKLKATTPDQADVLATAKNHDLKSARSARAQEDDWVYALVSVQTMSGFFGKGNYGIARMNGGFASRPCVGMLYGRTPGIRWWKDTERLLRLREKLVAPPWPYKTDGLVLTWLPTWDGASSLALTALDPFFIEVARRIRLVRNSGSVQALATPTNAPRIQAKEQCGVLGDPWTPINTGKKDLTALTVSSAGLTPQLLRSLIFEDGFTAAPMQLPDGTSRDQGLTFYASVLVRGQGTTDGFHSAALPIPQKACSALFGGGRGKDRLAELSQKGLADARAMQNKVLKTSLFSLLEAGPDKVNFDKREVASWVEYSAREFAAAWSQDYFDWLWRTVDNPDQEAARLEWLHALRDKASAVLESAMERAPQRSGRQYRARVRATGLFQGAIYKTFPELKEERDAKRTA